MPRFPPYFKLLIPVVNQVQIIFVYQVKNLYMTRLTLLTYLLGFGTALLRTTLRVELLHRRQYSDLQARRVPILFALWHGRMFLPIDVHRHTGIGTMASKSRDGEIITRWLENNGYRNARVDYARREYSFSPLAPSGALGAQHSSHCRWPSRACPRGSAWNRKAGAANQSFHCTGQVFQLPPMAFAVLGSLSRSQAFFSKLCRLRRAVRDFKGNVGRSGSYENPRGSRRSNRGSGQGGWYLRRPARDFEINPNMDVTGLTFRLYSTSLRIRPNSFPRPAPGSYFSSIHPRSAGLRLLVRVAEKKQPITLSERRLSTEAPRQHHKANHDGNKQQPIRCFPNEIVAEVHCTVGCPIFASPRKSQSGLPGGKLTLRVAARVHGVVGHP